MQNHYNLVYREEEREMIPLCIEEGIGVIPWSPLARGFLGGKRPAKGEGDTERARTDTFGHGLYYAPEDFVVADRVREVSASLGLPWAQVALAWMLGKPGITAPIIGATKMSHLDDAVAAIDVKLPAEDVARLEEPYVPHKVLM
jgi:aryl-alcohol dehydrogenase (NADP+)